MITVNYDDPNAALGNHLFQYSVCRLVALKNNYNFHIKYGNHLLRCFPDLDVGVCDGEILRDHHEDIHCQKYDPSIFDLPDFTDLRGFYQTDKYFQGNEELVKSWFNVVIDDDVMSVINKYPVDSFCYIHIRGCDYSSNYWNLPKKYYLDAMDLVRKIKPDISFVVVTDDVDLSKSYFPELDVICNDRIVDFKSLYCSKYCIISASTFSWWAAWLGDKVITIAPNNWLNYNKPLRPLKDLPCHNNPDFYPVDVKTDKFLYI